MWIVQLAIVIASILYSAYAARKNKPKAAQFEDGDFPTADEGTPQYVVFGDCWSADWYVLAWGNQRSKKIKKGGLLNKRTIGYKYSATLQMGLGRGPVNGILAIRVGDKPCWAGMVAANMSIYIDKYDLFGGNSGQGGIQGTLQVLLGGPAQTPPALLAGLLGADATGCRGVTTLLYDGILCAMSKSPQPWMIRHWRTTAGWEGAAWYPAKAQIELRNDDADLSEYTSAGMAAAGLRFIRAMNAAHILVEAATNRGWGRGMDMSELDLDSYTAFADLLYSEGFGLCLRYTRGGSLDDFIQQVLDHVGAAQYVSARTGLLTVKAIRNDYVVADLPAYGYDSGLLAFEDVDSSSDDDTNVVIVNYTDPVLREDRQVRARNAGAVQATGSSIATTRDYPGIPTWQLAQQVAERDLRSLNSGVKPYKVTLDRRGRVLEPASVFVLQAPEDGIDQIVLRVLKIERGNLRDGRIVVTCATDVFGLSAARISMPPGSAYVPPANGAVPATAQAAWELSYRDLARALGVAELAALPATAGYVGAVGKRPSSQTEDFALATRVGSADYAEVAEVECTPYAHLAAAIGLADTAIGLLGGSDLDDLAAGSAMLIGTEIVRVDAIDAAAGTATIARGCAHTVPVAHPAATDAWGYDDTLGVDPAVRVAGTTVNLKLLTRASGAQLDAAQAGAMSVSVAGIAALPYPPGRVRVAGVAEPASISGTIDVTWTHRNAAAQGAALIDHDAASITPAADVRYGLRFLDSTGAVLAEKLDTAGTSASAVLAVAAGTLVTMQLYAINNVGASQQRHVRQFAYTPPAGTTSSAITASTWTVGADATIIDGGDLDA